MAYAVLNHAQMNVSLYQAAAAMNAHARWQELITENLASGAVPGYRKRDVSFSAIQAGLDPVLGRSAPQFVIPSASSTINFQPGEIRSTANPMDFALEGPGFFEIQLPNGAKAYTRDGEFHVNSQGQLVTKEGNLVQSDSGSLQFDPNNGGAITVSPNGDVTQGTEVKGRLSIVEFTDPAKLTPIGRGNFLADKPGVLPDAAASTRVQQGFLEAANTSPTSEMASLITSMRLFEANSKVLQLQDERLGQAISELGNPSS